MTTATTAATASASDASEPYTLGTTDTVTALDPAGSYDLGSSTLQYSVFQTLLTIPAGENTPQGDAAESCEYDDPQTLTCTLKEGLKFSNGNDLTSSDVKYSFERALNIADPNGAAIYLLGSIGKPTTDGDRGDPTRDRDARRHDRDLPPEQARHHASSTCSPTRVPARSSTRTSSRPTRSSPTTRSSAPAPTS